MESTVQVVKTGHGVCLHQGCGRLFRTDSTDENECPDCKRLVSLGVLKPHNQSRPTNTK